jgi:hypothetical protein
MGRKSQAEVLVRRKNVLRLLLLGKNKAEIFQEIHSGFGVRLSSIEADITVCRKDMIQAAAKYRDTLIDESLNRYEDMYKTAREAGDVKEARQQQRAKEDVLGLHKQVITNDSKTVNLTQISTEALLEMKALLNKDDDVVVVS